MRLNYLSISVEVWECISNLSQSSLDMRSLIHAGIKVNLVSKKGHCRPSDYQDWDQNLFMGLALNSLRPRQNGCLFADDTFKRIFLNENIRISTKNSLKFVPKGLINNIPALVLIMAWRRPGDKPLSEPMLVKSLTHICVTRPQ